MILIHGECGSGKTAALRALEAAPPPGFRAVYVPVPTLDFTGMARWCLDRLHIAPGADPVAKLRESLRQTRVALLIDDAESMPLDAALAVRQLERDGRGGALVVAACASDQRETPALAALGVPAREIAVEVGGSAAAAAQVLAALGGARASHARGSARSASARLGAAVSVPGVPLGAAAAAAAPTVELATGAAPAPAAPISERPRSPQCLRPSATRARPSPRPRRRFAREAFPSGWPPRWRRPPSCSRSRSSPATSWARGRRAIRRRSRARRPGRSCRRSLRRRCWRWESPQPQLRRKSPPRELRSRRLARARAQRSRAQRVEPPRRRSRKAHASRAHEASCPRSRAGRNPPLRLCGPRSRRRREAFGRRSRRPPGQAARKRTGARPR